MSRVNLQSHYSFARWSGVIDTSFPIHVAWEKEGRGKERRETGCDEWTVLIVGWRDWTWGVLHCIRLRMYILIPIHITCSSKRQTFLKHLSTSLFLLLHMNVQYSIETSSLAQSWTSTVHCQPYSMTDQSVLYSARIILHTLKLFSLGYGPSLLLHFCPVSPALFFFGKKKNNYVRHQPSVVIT